MPDYLTRTTCRVCGSSDLFPLFSLGRQHVSDFVPDDRINSGPVCPIDLELCRSCSLVQAKHTAPQDFMYSRHYWYRSGVTETMREALRQIALRAEEIAALEPGDAVLDIGSNDGTLLRCYPSWACKIGVEPAVNLAEEGRRGLDLFINDFWSYGAMESYFDNLGGRKPRIITAIGMFYDLEDPNQFVRDVAMCLADDGVFVAQLMCLRDTIDRLDVGNFAHEHLEFYSLSSLQYLFNRNGLEVFDCEHNDVNGGSYRVYACKAGTPRKFSDRWGYYLSKDSGLDQPETYKWFSRMVRDNRDRCIDFVQREVLKGKRVWVYGASTKGNVILQYYGLDDRLIEAAVDRSPEKVGLHTVGTGIRIASEEEFRRSAPDYALVLPYAFLPEFVQRESEWRANGGKFIVPIPQFQVV